jgi:hypothetical protein
MAVTLVERGSFPPRRFGVLCGLPWRNVSLSDKREIGANVSCLLEAMRDRGQGVKYRHLQRHLESRFASTPRGVALQLRAPECAPYSRIPRCHLKDLHPQVVGTGLSEPGPQPQQDRPHLRLGLCLLDAAGQ